jgi:outer membrane receptor protein involved in Fe transport
MCKLINLFILLNILLSFTVSGAETNGVVAGKILADNKLPLEGAQVVLLAQRDSSFVKATASDKNGTFIFKQVNAGHYLVQVSMLGYKKETRNALVQADKSVLLTPVFMEVEAKNLGAIVITAQKPPVEIMADKTVINLESFVLNSGGNAFTVMQNLPGVVISNNGAVSLNGKSGAKVLIDGKISYLEGTELVNYLKSTPVSSLEKVELVANPSAKYDASGNSGIINIRTRRAKLMGFNMTLNSSYEQGKYGRANNNISFNHRNGKFNVFGMYGYYTGHDFVDLKISREFDRSSAGLSTMFGQDSYRKRADDNHYFNGGIHYFASPKTAFELSASGYAASRAEDGGINSRFYTDISKSDSTLRSSTNNRDKRYNFRSGLSMTHKIDSIGKEFSVSADYLHYSVEEDQLHNDLFAKADGGFSSQSLSKGFKDGTIGVFSAQTDLSYPVSDKLSFESGLKTTFVDVDNSSEYNNKVGQEWLPDYGLNCKFLYNENVNAAYISSKISRNQFHLEAGLRIENTNIKGHQLGNQERKDSLFRVSYTDLFPTASLTYSLKNSDIIALTYGRRINRPNYRDLNPFIYIFDAYTYEQGNTALKPQFSNNIDLSYIIRKNYSVSMFYSNIEQAIVKSYMVKENSKRVYVMPTNMASYNSYGLRVSVGQFTLRKFWNSNVYMALTRNNYKWVEDNAPLKNGYTTFLINMSNRITLPKEWLAELSGFYNGKMAMGQINVAPMWKVSAAIQKKLFKGNVTLSIYSNDIFNSYVTKINGLFNGNLAKLNERNDRCAVGISFTYRFRKGSEAKEIKKKSDSIDSKRINL